MEIHGNQSPLIRLFTKTIEFGNRWLTVTSWMFRGHENVFRKIEGMMAVITLLMVAALIALPYLPGWARWVVLIFAAQRVLEFLIVYSRNFILGHGRIFTHFQPENERGVWLILMFSLNVLQVVFAFAIGYFFTSLQDPNAFTETLTALDSFYLSVITFITVGYSDFHPITALPKILLLLESGIFFYVLVIVINGLISIHFRSNR
ncbi:two pore domain potassium channel family protein [Candidatus Peregrinibacteria bacterium]|nr:two pore domain potassium channel family protein [Candidatus Peregrinibacteria bacterium]